MFGVLSPASPCAYKLPLLSASLHLSDLLDQDAWVGIKVDCKCSLLRVTMFASVSLFPEGNELK